MRDFFFHSKKIREEKITSRGVFSLFFVILTLLTLSPLGAHAADIGDAAGVAIGCLTNPGACALGVVLSPIAVVMWAIFKLASVILGLAGLSFNWSLQIMVFEFSKYLGNSTGMLLAWGILRDFGNILLLFGFVFMGIATILDLHSYPWKKALPKLVIAAVLLNFSLFAAEAVIDTTNVLAGALYQQTYGNTICPRDSNWDQCNVNTGLAGVLLERVQITSAYENRVSDTLQGIGDQLTFPLENIIKFILLAIFLSFAAVVLFAASTMLISRGVTLAFLMVTSPIGFAGGAVGPLEELSKRWWKKLIDQALFAPVFILLLLASLKMTEGLNSLISTEGGLAAALDFTNVGQTSGVLIFFILMMGFLIGSLMMANQFGIAGADMATNAASGLVFGTVTRGANLIGGGSARFARYALQRGNNKNAAWRQVLTNRVLRPAEQRNNDLRAIPGVGALLGQAGITSGASPASHATYADQVHIFKDAATGKESKDLAKKYDSEIKLQKLEENAHKGAMDDDDKKLLASLSQKQLEELHGVKDGIPEIVENLTPAQFEKLMGSDKLSDTEKEQLQNARFERLGALVTSGAANIKAEVRKLSKGDLENVPASLIADDRFLEALSDSQREVLATSNKRTTAERQRVKDSSPVARFEVVFSQPGMTPAQINAHIAAKLPTLSPEQTAKIDENILRRQDVARELSRAVLEKLQREGKLSSGAIRDIGQHNPHVNAPGSPLQAYWS